MATQPTNLFAVPFANSGDRTIIPSASTTASEGAATLPTGFPLLTSTPPSKGGLPPNREDFNGILYMLSAFACFAQGGGVFSYQSTIDYDPPAIIWDSATSHWYYCVSANGPTAGVHAPSTSDSTYWKYFDLLPQPKTGKNTKVRLTASGTYTAPVTGAYLITLVGGGGGGGGASNDNATVKAMSGGGGGAGGRISFYKSLTAGTAYTYAIGAGGTAGIAGSSTADGGNGGTGGTTSMVVGSTTYSATGGGGGYGGGGSFALGGAGGWGKTGDPTYYRSPSGMSGSSLGNSGYAGASGAGGGNGGGTSAFASAGTSGVYGGGGSGGGYYSSVSYAGGAGGDGYIDIEYAAV